MGGISTMTRIAAVLVLVAAAAGCASESGACRWQRDCPAGQTCADGVCTTVVVQPDRGLPDLAAPDRGPGDALPAESRPDIAAGDGALCAPNGDGVLERDELLFLIPSSVDYTVGSQVAVDLQGTEVGGVTQWDLTASAADDHVEAMTLDPVPAWAAAEFPQAAGVYSSLLNKGYDTYGIFQATDSKLLLLGAISGDESYGRATYAEPVELLRFPLTIDDAYTTETTATGFWGLAPLYNVETYKVDVIARGQAKLPKMLPIDVLLVREVAQQYPYGNPFLKRTYTVFLFLAECYGTVARVVVDGDPGDALQLEPGVVQERWRITSP